MFNKRPDAATDFSPGNTTPQQTARQRVPSGGGSSVIGPDLVITGNLQSNGDVEIDGEIQGDVQATRITVGDKARITGTLMAEDVVVRGTVMGAIKGARVILQAASRVEGDVYHKSLSIEEGAYFEGKSRRSENLANGEDAAPKLN